MWFSMLSSIPVARISWCSSCAENWHLSGFPLTVTWLRLLPLILVNYPMIVACFFIGASFVCILRDFSMIIPLGMTFLLFSSGIFWDVHALGDPQKTELVLALNPVAFILDAYRHILMPQTVPDLLHLLQIAVVCFVLILAMAAIMRRSSQFRALKVLSA